MVNILEIRSTYQKYGHHTRNMVSIPEIWSASRYMVNIPEIWSTYHRYGQCDRNPVNIPLFNSII